jgi:hypothetical protein
MDAKLINHIREEKTEKPSRGIKLVIKKDNENYLFDSDNYKWRLPNKFKYVRAIVLNNENLDIVKYGRMHNDANVLSIGARFVKKEFLILAINTFLNTKFEGGRHSARILALDNL